MSSPVFLDISEFIQNPIRTGIQRVVREVIRNWPAEQSLRPIAMNAEADGFYYLPEPALDYALNLDRRTIVTRAETAERLREHDPPNRRRAAHIRRGDRILTPELFYDARRVALHHRLATEEVQLFYIVFDLLPWTRPALFNIGDAAALMPYLQLISRMPKRCFISTAVKAQFASRVLRQPDSEDAGVAIPLGADGLQLERRVFDPSSRTFVCFGTFDGRKGQEIVREAFLKLNHDNGERLIFVGRVPDEPARHLLPVLSDRSDTIQVITDASDRLLADILGVARASIYLSPEEGYGLPAIESLYSGLPLIAHAELPALSDIPASGQLRLNSTDPEIVAAAMRRLLDDAETARLWDEAAGLELQSWGTYGRAIANWALL